MTTTDPEQERSSTSGRARGGGSLRARVGFDGSRAGTGPRMASPSLPGTAE